MELCDVTNGNSHLPWVHEDTEHYPCYQQYNEHRQHTQEDRYPAIENNTTKNIIYCGLDSEMLQTE